MKSETPRELDAWIAKHVMGYRCEVHKSNGEDIHCYLYDENGRPLTGFPYFDPTTDPAAAMEVLKKCVEKLEDKRAFPAIEKYADHDGFQGWAVRALFHNGNQQTFSEVADTLELAICQFAKKLFSK